MRRPRKGSATKRHVAGAEKVCPSMTCDEVAAQNNKGKGGRRTPIACHVLNSKKARRMTGSAIRIWRKVTGTLKDKPVVCSKCGCRARGEHGAHVFKRADRTGEIFIIPLCVIHNPKKSDVCFAIKCNTVFVPDPQCKRYIVK